MRRALFLLLFLIFPVMPVHSTEPSTISGNLLENQQFQTNVTTYTSQLNLTLDSLPESDGYRTEYPVENIEGVFDVYVASDNLVWFTVIEDERIWVLNRSSSEIRSYTLPTNITPFLIKEDDDGSLWFTDYDFSALKHYDGIVHFDPKSLEVTVYSLPEPQTGPFDILLYGGKVWFTQWITGVVAILDPTDGSINGLAPDNSKYSGLPCGPVGITLTSEGVIWVVETLCSILVRIDPTDLSYQLHALPTDFYSPVFLSEGPEGNLWTGDHAGNKILKFNPATRQTETILVEPPEGGVWGFAGINEVEMDDQGRLWFAEHFTNRVGYYDTVRRTMLEFILPQADPLIQWIDVNATDLWYGIYSEGKLGLIEGELVPQVDLEVSEERISMQRVSRHTVTLEVQYSGQSTDAMSFAIAEQKDQIFGTNGEVKSLFLGIPTSLSVTVNVGNNIEIGSYSVLVGVRIDNIVVSRQITLDIVENIFYTVFVQGIGPIAMVYLIGFYKRSRKKVDG